MTGILATGSSFKVLSFAFRLGSSTVSSVVKDTCKALRAALAEDHMPVPSTEQLERVKPDFFTHWNFPSCVGIIDGKHCRVKCPPNTDTLYYSYKKCSVLQGVANTEYNFITIEVGRRVMQSDSGTFLLLHYECLESNHFNMSPDQELPGATEKLPNVLPGHAAYPLKTYLLKTYIEKKNNPRSTTGFFALVDALNALLRFCIQSGSFWVKTLKCQLRLQL